MPLRFAASVCLLGALPAQQICLAEGAPTALSIVAIPQGTPTAAGTVVLQNVELLPIEITGRYLGQQNDPTRSRLVERHGVSRVELPGNGRLLRYRRNGGALWGFLHVAADGTPRVALELPAFAGGDPFEDRIGVSRDGSHFAASELQGGLRIVRLDGQTYASTGRFDRLVDAALLLEPASVMVGDQVVWYQTELQQVRYCALVDNAVPVDVSPPPQPNPRLKDQMAMSGDGSAVVYLYGPQNLQQLHFVRVGQPVVVLPPAPSKYEEPDYLPEGSGSLELMLNGDGSRLLFVDSDVRDEVYLLDTAGVLPTLHITDDPIFQPYIGVHILPGFAADVLTVAIGDPDLMDWYRAALDPAGGSVVNLTATGSATMPFPEGTLDPLDGIERDGVRLLVEQDGALRRVRWIDPVTGATGVQHAQVVGDVRVATTVDGTLSDTDYVVPTLGGDVLHVANGGVGALPAGFALDAVAIGPYYRASKVEWGAGLSVPVFYLPTGEALFGTIQASIDQVCPQSDGGSVIVGLQLRHVSPAGAVVLNRPAAAFRRCLSGAGV
ncbi:MAG: hypothetical protein KAI24_10820 [Planctomycetes bacterium]|nr:hypothetical protein [Planctomycetota bacterium]